MEIIIVTKEGKKETFYAEKIYSDCGFFDVHLWEEVNYDGQNTKEISFCLRDIKRLVVKND